MTTESDLAIGNRARSRRLELEKSLKEVAGQVGIHFTTLGKLETGKMRFTAGLIHRIAGALSSDFSWLAWGTYEPDISYISVFDNSNLIPDRPNWPVGEQKVLFKLPVPEVQEDYACYALQIRDELDPFEQAIGPWIVVVSPLETEVTSGSMYAMIAEGETRARFVVPQHQTFGSRLWPSGEELRYGEWRFAVLGKVIYQVRNLGIPYLETASREGTGEISE